MDRLIGSVVVFVAGALLVGCVQRAPESARVESAGASAASVVSSTFADSAEGDQPRIPRLEREARAIAKIAGCSSVGACRTAPVGARSCGGPRTYLVYCGASTDTVALFRKLHELEAAEKAYNEKSGLMSTCEMRIAPRTVLDAGSCREVPR